MVVANTVEVLVDMTVDKEVVGEVTVVVLVIIDRNGTPSGRPMGGPLGPIVARDSTDCTTRWFLVNIYQPARLTAYTLEKSAGTRVRMPRPRKRTPQPANQF